MSVDLLGHVLLTVRMAIPGCPPEVKMGVPHSLEIMSPRLLGRIGEAGMDR
ncbi:MAG TPA: hypothetical protein VF740_05180 [Candidatus Acidoferrum sp.]